MPAEPLVYRVVGMDCPSDAAEVERAVRSVRGVEEARVSTATHLLTLRFGDASASAEEVVRAVAGIGYGLEVPEGVRGGAAAYRRALWIVVALNLGFGIAEMGGGFLSGSQALKADALDFLGDGSITFLALLAIGWSLAARARVAFLQGLFLGALGLGVVATTAARLLADRPPGAEVMGVLALAVNVASAAVLVPHRSGDANARAVWLFSRNDAIGNVAVIAAAALVAATNAPWPDLLVAFALAALFLHSAWIILRDAGREMRG
jgi:Co/Zn/Cd efflux system component/copper chaperone CopZ